MLSLLAQNKPWEGDGIRRYLLLSRGRIAASLRVATRDIVVVFGFLLKSAKKSSFPSFLCFCCRLSLLPVDRQSHEMASGDFSCFEVHPNLGLKKYVIPLIRVRNTVRNHHVLFLQKLWSLQRVLPVPIFPLHVIELYCEVSFNRSLFHQSFCTPKDALLVWSITNDPGSVYGNGCCKHNEISGCFG